MASTRTLGFALFAAATALGLSACTPTPGGAPLPATVAPAPGEAADSSESAIGDDGATAVSAVNTAEAHAGGRASELERSDDGAWEVHVAVGEREIEVRVGPDGTSVQSARDDDGIDADERAALDAAVTTLADAVRIATAQNPGGERLDEVQLDDDGSTWLWKVEMQDGSTVRLSASDGSVVRSGG